MAIDRAEQCRQWNADHHHQVMAGKERAKQFTHESQAYAGWCSWMAFMTRFRASTGSPQHFPFEAAKYLTPEMIRSATGTLPAPLQEVMYAAYCAGHGWGIFYWLLPDGVSPSLPDGTLFGEPDPHLWRSLAPGWLVCDECWLAAICPICQPDWWEDRVLARLPQALCLAHGGRVLDG